MGDITGAEYTASRCHSLGNGVALNATEEDETFQYHLGLLRSNKLLYDVKQAVLSPIFTGCVLRNLGLSSELPQYGLLAGISRALSDIESGTQPASGKQDPRVFLNVTPPSSTFICGSQGSGKSHTLSCMLENCLIPSPLGHLPNPLTGVVFHYDTFIGDEMGSPCEAAFLSTNPAVKVKVLCSPTNIRSMRGTYSRFNIDVQPLEIDEQDLNTKRMLDLMAVEPSNGVLPLYMYTVQRILREMRITEQVNGSTFDYLEFKTSVLNSGLVPTQLEPLKQRLEALESFMPQAQTLRYPMGKNKSTKGKGKAQVKVRGTSWKPAPGCLTIVDLSCPCISPETACALFNICLGIFLEHDPSIGRVVALDEAHKYMNPSPESDAFTNTLLSAVRLQRHLGVRVIISTQEPTVSTALLNLCSTTIVHRFTSPEWLRILHRHLAAAAHDATISRQGSSSQVNDDFEEDDARSLFNRIVRLNVGEALLFCPTAMVNTEATDDGALVFRYLGEQYLKVRVRARLTEDGGRSVLSSYPEGTNI